MRFRLKQKQKNTEWDMTPMIDVVFLLIVFFTLVINFTAADQNERIKLPISELAQPPEQSPTEPITLHILENGKVIYDGTDCSIQDLQEPLTHCLRVLKFLNRPASDVTVILRADARCEFGHVYDVAELCQQLGLTKLVWRTKQQDE